MEVNQTNNVSQKKHEDPRSKNRFNLMSGSLGGTY
ncbi:Uncharacterised protein [uncultured archaeon]|nr:Uncharacterised protein [uncultured archaeon]